MPQTQIAHHPFSGGLDIVSPVLNVEPGYLLDGINYEPDINGGYRRIPGYERFDGHPSPSDRENTVLQLDDASLFMLGDTLTGQTSDATGIVVLIDEQLVCLCSVTGEFEEEIVSNGTNSTTVTSLIYTIDALRNYTRQERWQAIETHYRDQIEQPPGTGKIEGVCHYKGTTYAFRNAGQLVTVSQSSNSGWIELPQKHFMRFKSAGHTTPEEGNSFTTPAGASATITRYIRQGGSQDDLSVYGYFLLDTITGTINPDDRLELGTHSAGTVHSTGYLTLTIEDIATTATLPAVGDQIKNQTDPPAQATVHEVISRQPGDTADVINCWFLLSDVTETFADGDRITRVVPEGITESEPFGNIKGHPLPAIRISHENLAANFIAAKYREESDWPQAGDILDIASGQGEARVFWQQSYDVKAPQYGELWLTTEMTVGTGNDNNYVGAAFNTNGTVITGNLDPKALESLQFQWFCRKDNKYLILRFINQNTKPDDWPDTITLLAENKRLTLNWKDRDTANNTEAGYQEEQGISDTYDPWDMANRDGQSITFTLHKGSVTYNDEFRLYLVLQDVTGTIKPDDSIDVIQIAGYASGQVQAVTLRSGGRFEFRTWNFFARPDQERIYGCNGQGWAFELNPLNGQICPILMDDEEQANNPHVIEAHKNHLFLGLPGGLVRHSVIGEPLNFNGQLGAFEVGAGDEVTALISHPGDVLAIICRNRIQGLYGQTIDDWQMNLIAENTGGYAHSVQMLGQAYMLDDNGIIELQRVMAYGNFEYSTISRLVQPLVNRYKTSTIGSAALRDHNLITLYGSGGNGLTYKPNPGKLPEIMNFEYLTTINCVHYAEDETGSARVFFGSDDGWVYEARKGSNFDGQPIEAVLRTAYNHLKSPTYRKAFKRLELMLSGGYDVYLQVGMELDYSAAYTPAPAIRSFTLFGGQGGYWNEDNWNEFFWSGQDVSTGDVSVSGTGKNYSLMIYSSSAWTDPYTLQGVIIHYIPRRLDRG